MMENSENLSREIEWFMETLKKDFQIVIQISEIGLEATELGVDEVENFFVPQEIFTELPDTFLYELMVVDDEEGNEWVGGVAFYPDTPNWCLQVITKNSKILKRIVTLPQ